jgi:hypothetical protein
MQRSGSDAGGEFAGPVVGVDETVDVSAKAEAELKISND